MTRGDKFRIMTDEEIVDAAFDAGIDMITLIFARTDLSVITMTGSSRMNGARNVCWSGYRRMHKHELPNPIL